MKGRLNFLAALALTFCIGGGIASCSNSSSSPASTLVEPSGSRSITIYYDKAGSESERHGTVKASKTTDIAPGEKIYLTITPDDSYELDKLDVQCDDGGNVYVTDNSFDMPNKDVSIVCSFEEAQGAAYTVSSSLEIQNGKLLFFSGEDSSPSDSWTASKGTTVVILALPNDGFEIDALTATNASGAGITVYGSVFAMPESDVTVSATFKPSVSSYTVKSSGIQNGTLLFSVGDRPKQSSLAVSKGTTVVIDATPNDGYNYVAPTVKDAAGNEIPVTQKTFIMPESDVTVSVDFKKVYLVSHGHEALGSFEVVATNGSRVNHPLLGECTGVMAGERVACSFSMSEVGSNKVFKSFDVTGLPEGTVRVPWTKYSFEMPEADVSLGNVQVGERIKVEVETKQATGGTISVQYYGGSWQNWPIDITATPTTGEKDYYVESLWVEYEQTITDAEGNSEVLENIVSLPVDKAGGRASFKLPAVEKITIKAIFTEKKYSIKLAGGITGGTITGFSESGNSAGDKVCLTVKPDGGYKLSNKNNISITGADVELDDFYCFDMPKADITIGATFDFVGTVGHSITIKQTDHGTVVCDKTINIMPGSTVLMEPIADIQYGLSAFNIKNGSGGTVANYGNVFIMPDSDVTLSATFLPLDPRKIRVRTPLRDFYIENFAPGERVNLGALIDDELAQARYSGYAIKDFYLRLVQDQDLADDNPRGVRCYIFYDGYGGSPMFYMPTSSGYHAFVELYLKAAVKPKPDTYGDVVLNDGTAVAIENVNKLTEEQKGDAIAIIFYDGKSDTSLGNCVLGMGLAESKGRWCGDDLDYSNGGYTKFTDIAADMWRGDEYIDHVHYDGSIVGVFFSHRNITFRGNYDGQIRGTNNYAKVRSLVGRPDEGNNLYAFKYCDNYKDQPGSRVAGTKFESGWYLPTVAEISQMLVKPKPMNNIINIVRGTPITTGDCDFGWYWTSNQVKSYTTKAWLVNPSECDVLYIAFDGSAYDKTGTHKCLLLSYDKDSINFIRPIREF
ncbi:MAG: hypothetical protein VZQ47_00620 [Treponema sp.]|nr:hypothetical protein [Treponema sp.]